MSSSSLKVLFLTAVFTCAGCSDGGMPVFSSAPSAQAAGRSSSQGGYYKIGNPYQVAGVTYYPKEDYTYREVGVSSWYGADFHNGMTANGEVYDMHSLTAAHRTLPLPSVVRVTNLQNGRSLVLRVNDRGPFVNNRIIDVSMRAAQLLGFKDQGTTQVEVEILPEESRALKEALLSGREAPAFTANDAPEETMVQETPKRPVNLNAQSEAGSYHAETAPAAFSQALIETPTQTAEPQPEYNDWDADRSKADAAKTVEPEKIEAVKPAASAVPASMTKPVAVPATAASAATVAPKPKAPAKAAPAAQVAPAAPAAPVAQAAPAAPAKKAASARKSAQTGVVTTGSFAAGYYVQVGAFSSEENAQKMVQKVSRFGNVAVSPVKSDGKTLYRVRLGPADARKAVEMMDNVENAGILGARLVEEKKAAPAKSKAKPAPARASAPVSDDEF